MDHKELNVLTGEIINAAMKVHTILGPGLLESAYEACLAHELRTRGFHVETQIHLPVVYEGIRVDKAYRIDMLIEREVIVELKAVTSLAAVDHSQSLSNLKLSGFRVALMINFHVRHLKDGIHRFMN
jgi:GxxExxY protein